MDIKAGMIFHASFFIGIYPDTEVHISNYNAAL